jgi:hypothetical protein
MLTWTIKVDGVTVGYLKGLEYFGAADQAEMCTLSCPIGSIVAGKDIDLRIAHNDAGSVIIGVVRASLSARRIGT